MQQQNIHSLLAVPSAQQQPHALIQNDHTIVLFNRRAKGANDRFARLCRRLMGEEYFISTGSLDDAESACRRIVQSGYKTVICGGGDGTLIRAYNLIANYVLESNQWREERRARYGEILPNIPMPAFGFLPLGTGNSIKRITGTHADRRTLKFFQNILQHRILYLPMITDGDDAFYFGGFGMDSLLLNHYNQLKKDSGSLILKPILQSVLGYLLTAFGQTIPRIILGRDRMPDVRVRALKEAYFIDPRKGDRMVPIEAGTILYEGRVSLLGAATSSFYGYGFKAFPFAGLSPNHFHLRIATMGPAHAVSRLIPIWRGTYRSSHDMFDFFAQDVDIELHKPFAYQHSGDALGDRTHVRWRIHETTLPLLDAHPMRFQPTKVV